MQNLTIVMYHYVREIRDSRFPAIKGLEFSDFRKQLDYLQKHYQFVTVQNCMEAIGSGKKIPENSVLLTFDDGYSEHFTHVFPVLEEKGIQGAFFPPGRAIAERRVLDVNKIHFILAQVENTEILLKEIRFLLDGFRAEYSLPPTEELYRKLATESRYDTKDVIFIKRLLQRELDVGLRAKMVGLLFEKFVSENETTFANELYMSRDQLKCMVRHGMYVGSHGWEHFWLDSLPEEEQKNEIGKSLSFLESVGAPTKDWVMCFPYGAYNDSVLSILKNKNCRLGLSTRVGIANLTSENALTLERLDTNDFPRDAHADPVKWTQAVALG